MIGSPNRHRGRNAQRLRDRVCLRKKLILSIIFLFAIGIPLLRSVPNHQKPPQYLGLSLEEWRRRDFHEFREAALTLGTNTIPYLISELSAKDPAIRRLPQKLLDRLLTTGEVFTTSKGRRFDASCVLCSFGTNAIPALLSAAFSARGPAGDDLVFECAGILGRSNSPEASAMKMAALLAALTSGDPERARASLVILAFGEKPSAEVFTAIRSLQNSPIGRVQEALTVFYGNWPTNTLGGIQITD